jgi:hypothetical protein
MMRYSERPELWGVPGDRGLRVPAGLTTVHIDRERDLGEYWEPNVWIIHQARRG